MAYIQATPMTIQGEYLSPVDGNVYYRTANTLSCSGFSFTVDDSNCYIVSIRIKQTGNTYKTYVNGYNNINITSVANVISMSGITTPFVNTDSQYYVSIKQQQKGYDITSDSSKTIVQGADWGSKIVGPIPLIAAAQTITTSFADIGYEIPCFGYNTLGVWIKITIQQSLGIQIQALAKHTIAGTEEYNMSIESVSSTLVNINPEYIQFPDVNGLYLVKIKLDNVIPYIQLQIKMTTDAGNDATLDTIYYVLGY